MHDSYGRTIGVFRDHRKDAVTRYYRSNQTDWGRRHGIRRFRIKAEALEELIMAALTSWLSDREQMRAVLMKSITHAGTINRLSEQGARIAKRLSGGTVRCAQSVLKALFENIDVSPNTIRIVVRAIELPRLLRWDGTGLFRGDEQAWGRSDKVHIIDVPVSTVSIKRELTVLLKRKTMDMRNTPNRRLTALLRKARAAQHILDEREVCTVTDLAARIHCRGERTTRLVRLNYLAPDIIASILDGTQPSSLNSQTLLSCDLPMDWTLQRRLLGFPDQPDFMKAAAGW